jgi:hypothetical protein
MTAQVEEKMDGSLGLLTPGTARIEVGGGGGVYMPRSVGQRQGREISCHVH